MTAQKADKQLKVLSIFSPPPSPLQRRLEFPGRWGISETKTFKEMYQAQWEFPEGLGDLEKNPFHRGGMDIFWNYTLY